MADLGEILKTVLSLEIEDRAAVAEKLLESLEDLSEAESDRVWGLEAQRRLDAYRAGLASAVPAAEVAGRLRSFSGDRGSLPRGGRAGAT